MAFSPSCQCGCLAFSLPQLCCQQPLTCLAGHGCQGGRALLEGWR